MRRPTAFSEGCVDSAAERVTGDGQRSVFEDHAEHCFCYKVLCIVMSSMYVFIYIYIDMQLYTRKLGFCRVLNQQSYDELLSFLPQNHSTRSLATGNQGSQVLSVNHAQLGEVGEEQTRVSAHAAAPGNHFVCVRV